MIACDDVVYGFPQPFFLIHPGMVDGLEEQFELGIDSVSLHVALGLQSACQGVLG